MVSTGRGPGSQNDRYPSAGFGLKVPRSDEHVDESSLDGMARVVLVSLYSARYPSIGESHGLSVIGGATKSRLGARLASLTLIDKVATGVESCEDVVRAIRSVNANVVGIAVQYGTYSVLEREYRAIKEAFAGRPHLVAFGGPIATYLGDEILDQIDPDAVIVEGEGDSAFPDVVLGWLETGVVRHGPNRRFRADGYTHVGKRLLGDLASAAPPFREHIAEIAATGGQIYVESSRGCSWAACTFCLRGLTDVRGRGDEYRRVPAARLAHDIEYLSKKGIVALTFADEDFMGGPIEAVGAYVGELLELLRGRVPDISFDVSVTIDSVLGSRDSLDEAMRRDQLLRTLKAAGLRKVFLGIESGSYSQLRRYAKGHRPEGCAKAVRRLRDLGVIVEVGFIMFDPLCTLTEIAENLAFLKSEELVGGVSALTNEMRLLRGSTYVRLLEHEEQRSGRLLFDRSVDRDTLSLAYTYRDNVVGAMVATVKATQRRADELIYPLKSLTRYGERGAFGESIGHWREILDEVRAAQFAGLEALVADLMAGGQEMHLYAEHLVPALEFAAEDVLQTLGSSAVDHATHPVIRSVAQSALKARMGYFRQLRR